MLDISSIASQVKYNCNISDARYWGLYSPCGLLLRLRDLYKIENGLKPWERVERNKMGDWIEKKEKLWEKLDSKDFKSIEIRGRKYQPFDVKHINSILIKQGFIYGAGYGNFLKPVFILAELFGVSTRGRYNIYISGREVARDLSTSPAMLQRNTIIVRHETMKLFLWGKFEEMVSRKYDSALSHAFSEYGISKDITNHLSPERIEELFTEISQKELAAFIYHELGEASQRRLLGSWWKTLLLRLPYSRAELFIRGLKDVLSDTCNSGMLAHIIKNKKAGSLAFYVALLSGFRKKIFPDIVKAYDEFRNTRNWRLIEEARIEGYKRTRGYIRALKGMVHKGRISPETIETELMSKIV